MEQKASAIICQPKETEFMSMVLRSTAVYFPTQEHFGYMLKNQAYESCNTKSDWLFPWLQGCNVMFVQPSLQLDQIQGTILPFVKAQVKNVPYSDRGG